MKVRSRRARRLNERLKKAVIWLVIVVFVLSVVGVAVVTISQ